MTLPDYGELVLDGMRFRLAAPLDLVSLASFQQKITFGDYTKDAHDLLSTWVISDLSGGHGIIRLRAGTDLNRCRFATLYTRHPNQTVLPRKPHLMKSTASVSPMYPLGDHVVSGVFRFYAADNTTVFQFQESGDTWTTLGTAMSAVAVNKAIEFKGTGTRLLFIPCGSTGYATVNNTTLTNVAASGTKPGVQAFALWADKLLALDTAGQMWRTTDGTNWTSYGSTAKLDVSETPRNIIVHYDRADNPLPLIVSDSGVWAFDAAGPTLYPIRDFSFPPHPSGSLGSCVWRGDAYVSTGMDVTRYTGASVSPGVGLSRDDGLPYEYRNYVKDLEPEYNGLYALVVGKDQGSSLFSVGLHVYTGFGWHTEWSYTSEFAGSSSAADITWVRVSKAQSAYRLWWSAHGDLYSFVLPTEFTNPRALVLDSLGDFDTGNTHYLETGRFDADMAGFDKIANAVHLHMGGGTAGATMTNVTMTVKYRIDGATSYTTLGSVTVFGETILPFGTNLANAEGTSSGLYSGVAFEDIELKVEINKSSGGTTSPILENFVLSFLKVRGNSISVTADIDLSTPHAGQNPDTMDAKLNTLIDQTTFFLMEHQDATYRVRLGQYRGSDNLGRDSRSRRRISIVEVPLELGG